MSSYVILIIIEEAFSKRHWQNSSISLDKLVPCAHVETNHWPEEDYLLSIRIHSLELGLRLPCLEVLVGERRANIWEKREEKVER